MNRSGLSSTRLGAMHEVMASHVRHGDVPGLVTLISRRGEVHVDAIGNMAVDGDEPMRRDTIFRIASLTKPVAATAAMLLVEECKIRLDEPVDRLLPELADRRVLNRLDGPLEDTVPATRPLTARDLLTLRMGMGYIMADSGDYPIQHALNERQLLQGPMDPASLPGPDEWMRRVGELPLMRQPGEAWMYDLGLDVLGVLIARAAGQSLDAFLQDRIFAPLGMKDTGFYAPPDKTDRLAASYFPNAETGMLDLLDGAKNSNWSRPPSFPSAAGGLVSTVDDYLAFGLMLLHNGAHGNERLLSRPSVATMTTDQLTLVQRQSGCPFLGEHQGWGFGMSVNTARDAIWATPGRFGWDGGLGTSWASDPREEMVAILMTQRAFSTAGPGQTFDDFWTLVYQAIDD